MAHWPSPCQPISAHTYSLGHSHAHVFINCQWLLSNKGGSVSRCHSDHTARAAQHEVFPVCTLPNTLGDSQSRFNRKSSFLQDFWILTPYQIHGLQTLSPIPQAAFLLHCLLPLLHRSLLGQQSPICLFLLQLLVLLGTYPRNHCQDQCHEGFLYGFF